MVCRLSNFLDDLGFDCVNLVSRNFKNNDLAYELARVPIKEQCVDHGV